MAEEINITQQLPVQKNLSANFFAFGLSLLGNISLSSVFVSALLHPSEHAEFLSGTVIAIYFFEFLSLHSTGMMSGTTQNQESGFKFVRENKKLSFEVAGKSISFFAINLVLFGIYALFAVSFAAAYKNWIIAGTFFVSVLSKWLAKKSLDTEESGRLAFLIMAFLFSTALMIPLQGVLKNYFPINIQLSHTGSGLFQQVPQTILAWGAIYYGLCGIIEYGFFNKMLKTDGVSASKRILLLSSSLVFCFIYFLFFF